MGGGLDRPLTTSLTAHAIIGIQDGDETSIYDSSQALHTLQKLFGLFPRITGKGDHAGVSFVA